MSHLNSNNYINTFRCVFTALLVFVAVTFVKAQTPADSIKKATSILKSDSIKASKKAKDTVEIESVVKQKRVRTPKDPNIALFRAAVVPGLGQIYNKRYWKLPIVYGGFAALGYAINFNQKYYTETLNEYIARTDGDINTKPNTEKYGDARDEQIISAKDFYKRNREISIIGTVALYAAQVIDAYVDAELSNFDVSDDLSLKIGPSINQGFAFNGAPNYSVGLSLKFTLKK